MRFLVSYLALSAWLTTLTVELIVPKARGTKKQRLSAFLKALHGIL